jgi:hypothetical protein
MIYNTNGTKKNMQCQLACVDDNKMYYTDQELN